MRLRATTFTAMLAALWLVAPGCAQTLDDQDVARGRTYFRDLGCADCHRVEEAASEPAIGPSLAGLYGRLETLADGSRLVVDEAYLREAITDPDRTTVAGYDRGVMIAGLGAARPKLRDPDVVDALIAYIRSLR